MTYSVGEIVKVWIPDPKNQLCDEPHPALIFKTSDATPKFWVAGITGSFNEPIPWHWLKMPWDINGHPITGLVKPCVLKAEWVVLCSPGDVVNRMGHIATQADWESVKDKIISVQKRKQNGEPL